MLATSSARKGRWEFLDAIRGIAALAVLLQHGLERWSGSFTRFTTQYFNLGEAAVVAFFLVSGFIIPVSLERHRSLKRFWVGRAFRLLPMYWLSFAVVLLFNHVGLIVLPRGFEGHWPKSILGNVILMQDFMGVPLGIGTYWTLTYETVFYCLCSVIFLFGLLSRSWLLALSATLGYLFASLAVGVLAHRSLSADKLGLITTAFIGALLYRHSIGEAARRAVLQVITAMAFTVPVVQWLRHVEFLRPSDTGLASLTASCAAWLVGYLLFGLLYALRRREFHPILLWLGRSSYSVYLVHGIIVLMLPRSMPIWIAMPLLITSTLLIAELTYRWIEQPLIALNHHLSRSRPRAQLRTGGPRETAE